MRLSPHTQINRFEKYFLQYLLYTLILVHSQHVITQRLLYMNMINIITENNIIFLSCISILGLLIGSFLNVVVYRLPIMIECEWNEDYLNILEKASPLKFKIFNLFTPRSHCPNCQEPIPFWVNIPIISYFILGGKCRDCGLQISWRYPFIEVLSSLFSLFIAYHFGATWHTGAVLVLTWALIALVFIDIDHQILPDNITLPLIWLGLLLNAFGMFTTPQNAILGACSGYTSLWLIAYAFKLIRKIDGMGHGDFKLFAVFGAWLGWQSLPLIILIASLIGAIAGITLIVWKKYSSKQPVAFGPALAIAGWLMTIWGNYILSWYLPLMHL